MESLTLILCSILAFCLAFYLLATYFRPYARLKAIGEARRVLLVVSHPDDESMFFGPTLLNLCRSRGSAEGVFLLCMSNGDFRKGQGAARKHELIEELDGVTSSPDKYSGENIFSFPSVMKMQNSFNPCFSVMKC